MPTLYLIRHGLAGAYGSHANDEERPLTEDGRCKTRRVAERLRDLGVWVELILTSPLDRARQTAEIFRDVGIGAAVIESRLLAPEGTLADWVTWFAQWQREHRGVSGVSKVEGRSPDLALVGHEPNLSTWAAHLVGGETPPQLVLKKAGIIGLQVPEQGTPVGASELFWLTPPRLLI